MSSTWLLFLYVKTLDFYMLIFLFCYLIEFLNFWGFIIEGQKYLPKCTKQWQEMKESIEVKRDMKA